MNQQPPMYHSDVNYYQAEGQQQPYAATGQPYAAGQPYYTPQPYGSPDKQQAFYAAQPTSGYTSTYPPTSHIPPNEDTPISSYAQHTKPDTPTPVDEERFPSERTFRDWGFMLLFILHLVAFFILAITSISYEHNHSHDPPNSNSTTPVSPHERVSDLSLMSTAGAAVLTAICFSYFWLNMIRKYPRPVTYISIAASLGFLAILTFCFLSINQIGLGVFFGVLLILEGFFVYLCRSRIEFAANTLACVGRLVTEFRSTQLVALTSLIPLALYCIIWMATFKAVLVRADDQHSFSYLLLLFCCFSLYWTTQVLKGVVHVTCAGTFATWYFLAERMPSHPTWHAFRRSITTSFGSICLGAMLVAIVKTIRAFFAMLRGSDDYGFLALLVDCILSAIDGLVQYFNRYAYVQVAVYGKTFCQSAKATWNLFKLHGFEAIINDDFTGEVLSLGVLIGGVASALIGGIFGAVFTGIHQSQLPSIIFACFFIGIVLVLTMMEIIDSGVATIFVCFVEQPDRLRTVDPDYYQKFRESYGNNMGLFDMS
eukprot:TRINITY_DN7584_c0_g1_i5.p1 TRINITY_DN7584_c0_g1~~TRINITY_DN7584_c0_g1_i5.p1  ORF type:complete len:540 (+),score=85.69 TRINITY_DN7584_c0_g1_i5:136-1755(+)